MKISLKKIQKSFVVLVATLLMACSSQTEQTKALPILEKKSPEEVMAFKEEKKAKEKLYYYLDRNITTGQYFDFIDSLVTHFDTLLPYELNEHLIVRANPWLIVSFENTDYYHLAAQGKSVYDPNAIVVLHRGDRLLIPSEIKVALLKDKMANTIIDVNIPEFRMTIIEGSRIVQDIPVRVGKNTRRYLAMAGRKVDLRTRPGTGSIVRINRDPAFINPRNNKRYKVTRRDDGAITLMPRIPWIEPEINGMRYGQLIHPTTNLKTLGKAYSNGCVGTSEGDAWKVYFYAPLGTQVRFRYELETLNETGDTLIHKDIYPGLMVDLGV